MTVTLDIENRSSSPTSFLLLEDQVPASLGRPARLVVSGIPGRGTLQASYSVLPQVRGRYRIGPLAVDVTDAFALTRLQMEFDEHEDLLVTPEIEDLERSPDPSAGMSFGSSRARQLFRTGEEYYTMRQYQEGDDLRRLHWASVARTGQLMIRQDESTRRASGLVFLDNRAAAVGQTHTAPFERAVSVAATLGVLLTRKGFVLRVSTADVPPTPVTEDRFLDTLAALGHSASRTAGPALANLRAGAAADTSLVLVGGIRRAGRGDVDDPGAAGYGPKLAVLIYPVDPQRLTAERLAELEGRATAGPPRPHPGGLGLHPAPPSMRLNDRWHVPKERPLAHSV